MNTKTFYEATNDITPFSIPFIIFCLFFILTLIVLLKLWKNSSVSGRCGLVLIPVLMSVAIVSQFSTFFATKQLFEEFKNGNCEIAEGKIVNYEQNYEIGTMAKENYPDRFFVDNTEFIVYGYSTYGLEYSLRQTDGSILKNGQNVRITYSNRFHENLILKIEIINQNQSGDGSLPLDKSNN